MTANQKREFTILMVDDKDENLLALEDILQADHRILLKARSGNEALKIALKNDKIGLIMLDVQMPGMDGFEVASLLKSNARTRDMPIIFVTAISKEEQYVLKGFEEGAVDYLQKPLDINVTLAKVNVFEQLYFYQRDLKDTIEQKEVINKQLERFMYVVAHDLKSPLSGIVGMLNLLKDDERIRVQTDLEQYVSMMFQASYHLTDMISSILDYSRKNNTQQSVEEVDVHAMVQDIARLLFPPSHIAIFIEGHLPVMHTQKFKLHQVFQNLMSNAIKYNDKPQGSIAIGFEDIGNYYKFYVRDNGPGIASKDKALIFNLFETTKNPSSRDSSTGVGLNILKVLVEQQGGKIGVDSVPGEGSTFHFEWLK